MVGIRTRGRKAELIERIKANATYQADVTALSKMEISSEHQRSLNGIKRSCTAHYSDSNKKHKKDEEEHSAIDALFSRFADPEANEATITDEGILAFCDALGIDAQDPVMLALSYTMGAETMGIYTRTEFRRGLHKLQCTSIEELRRQIPTLRDLMQDPTHFAAIYSFSFGFSKDPTQKSLALDLALGLWDFLLPGHFHWYRHWMQYVRENSRSVVSRDLWLQVLDFGLQMKPDLSNYDENGAWPVLLDDFAAHMLHLIRKKGLVVLEKDEQAMGVDMTITEEDTEHMVMDD